MLLAGGVLEAGGVELAGGVLEAGGVELAGGVLETGLGVVVEAVGAACCGKPVLPFSWWTLSTSVSSMEPLQADISARHEAASPKLRNIGGENIGRAVFCQRRTREVCFAVITYPSPRLLPDYRNKTSDSLRLGESMRAFLTVLGFFRESHWPGKTTDAISHVPLREWWDSPRSGRSLTTRASVAGGACPGAALCFWYGDRYPARA
jgi:hypothetical protein